jgi:hypothetical protein
MTGELSTRAKNAIKNPVLPVARQEYRARGADLSTDCGRNTNAAKAMGQISKTRFGLRRGDLLLPP